MINLIKKIFSAFLIVIGCGTLSFSQNTTPFTAVGRGGVATTFATDYQAIGINPANLGVRKSFRDPKLVVGALETNTTFFAAALNRQEIFETIFRFNRVSFDYSQKQSAARKFVNAPISVSTDIMLFGVAAQHEKFGGLAFNIYDRINFFTRLNAQAANIAFLGPNSPYFDNVILSDGTIRRNTEEDVSEEERPEVIAGFTDPGNERTYSDILSGSRVSMSWFREYNFAYGKKIIDNYNFTVHAGLGIRFVQGIALIDLAAGNNGLRRNNIAMSPTFGLDFGDSANVDHPTFAPITTGAAAFRKLTTPESVGSGFGMDFGIHVVIKKNLHIAASITNVTPSMQPGVLNWQSNVYELSDGNLAEVQGAGYDNYNLLVNSESALQFAGTQSPFQWRGSREINVELPSMLRLGVSYNFFKTAHIGIDYIIPRNDVPGNLAEDLIAVGADIRLNRLFSISSGFNIGGNQGGKVNVPVGMTYTAFKQYFEAGVSTADISTYLADLGQGSTLSLAMGFLRFKF